MGPISSSMARRAPAPARTTFPGAAVVCVKGDESQYAGATAHGGLLVIRGNASSRCGISMKGIDIVVQGNIGHMSAFMGQAGERLGGRIYEARLFVRGRVESLGSDCIEKEMRAEHHEIIADLLRRAGISKGHTPEFSGYGSGP